MPGGGYCTQHHGTVRRGVHSNVFVCNDCNVMQGLPGVLENVE